MRKDRRNFLKKLGVASLFGIGSAGALDQYFKKTVYAELFKEDGLKENTTRWGMVIDMTKCEEGCTACIDACHFQHNVPEISGKKEEVKWIWKEAYKNAFPSKSHPFTKEETQKDPVLTLCNHCKNPPCVRVCPTKATFKREDGIVMMDFHRCIGCRFCMAGCPYGSRSFNFKDPRPFIKKINPDFPTREKGVVEKCNFCAERLAKGQAPACQSACNNRSIVFGNLGDPNSEIRRVLMTQNTLQRKTELGTDPSVFYIF
ncbi:MAG: 4Fe-4S dicluster domain-containing protein [Deltaproteobacteria bacterium]|nr:4Fe-4S dicluster domain-containing protein [Deltaproteobacteria bacterium]